MLYVGFFRFEFEADRGETQEAEFSYLVEADSIDEACQVMGEQITGKYSHLLNATERLMLDDCIEIAEVPRGGVLLRMSQAKQRESSVMLSVLPEYDGDKCLAYRQGPDPAEDLEAANAFEPEPFLTRSADGGHAAPDAK
ncbi:MAG: hypothetical protein DWQ37_11870 [Planctomycetota bacterium]|nr:MAG: hypothetical protein DWQ37_11870 [Planctomycetota bacterium]